MTLLGLIVVIVLVGFLLWVINTFVPMEPKIKMLLSVVVVLVLVLWLLQSFGLLGPIGAVRLR